MRYAYGSHATRAGPQREQCSHAAVSTRKGEAATRQAGYEVAFAQERAFRKEGLLLRAAMRPGKPWTHGQLWQSVLSEDSKHGSGEPDMLFFLTIESVTLA
jgi:hypothetical protein